MAMRCSVRNLTVQDQEQYVRAVKKLKEEGKYDWYVKTHSEASDLGVAHRGPAFLPWHRQFILSFEQDLQRVLNDKSFALPYWDWTADAALSDPTKATVWSNDFMGGNGNPVTGPFSPANGWTTVDSSGKPAGGLTRNFGGSSSARTLPTSADVNAALQVSSYDVAPYDTTSAPDKSFRNRLEGWVPASTAPNLHNRVHVWVGGAMLNVPTAPNDPVFFLHHCYVDRIWALWQQKYPNAEYPKSGAPKQNLNDPMWPWNVTPAAVLNHTELGYYYDFDGSISTNWSADALIPNKDNAFGTSGTPALAVFKDKLYCIREGRGNSGWVWCASTSDGSNWSTDALIPNKDNAFGTSGTPALAVFNDKLYCVREGRGNSGWVWCASTSDGINWSTDALIPNKDNAFGTSGTPALAVFKDKLYCIREGRGNSGWVWCASTSDGSNWSTDALIPNKDNAFGTSGTPALAVFNDKLYCAREGRGNSGWVWCAFETSSRSGNPKGKDEL